MNDINIKFDWNTYYLSDIAKTTSGGTPDRKNKNFYDGQIPWVKSGELKDNFLYDTEEKITEEALKNSSAKLFPVGTLLLAMYGATVGKTSILKIPAATNQAVCGIFPDSSKANVEFLRYRLIYDRPELLKQRYGGAQPNISQTIIRNHIIKLPGLKEQQRIAHILSTVQRAIEQQERLIQVTTELKKSLMHKLFTEGTRGEPQKETEIGLVPESWELKKLGDIANKISKGSSPRWQGFNYVDNGVLFVRSQNVGEGRMDFSDKVFLPVQWNKKESRSVLKKGDILINLVGASIGRIALGTQEIDSGNCNQAVCFIRIYESTTTLKQFIVYYLLSPSGQNQMFLQKKDIARANLSLLDVKGFVIPIPNENEVNNIANTFVSLDDKIELHKQKQNLFKELFSTLLHQLMTAQIRVHEIEFEGMNDYTAL